MDPEEEEDKVAIILDTNILLASILKRGSYTRQVIIYLTDILGMEIFTPEKALQEIEEHLEELAKRKRLPIEKLKAAIKILLLGTKIVRETTYRDFLEKARDCVKDPADADFAALAIHLHEKYEYEKVVLLTWNKRDYKDDCLEARRILVHTPSDLRVHLRVLRNRKHHNN